MNKVSDTPDHRRANDIVIAGAGNAARATALALAAAGLPVAVEPHLARAPTDTPDACDGQGDGQGDWTLSPAARMMLEALDVWADIDLPSSPILDMQVFGRATATHNDAALLPSQLGFAPPQATGPEDGARAHDATPLGHIVSLAALGRALATRLEAQIEAGGIQVLPAAITDFDPAAKTMTLGDDARRTVGLFIDSYREMRIWRQRGAARPLQYDYQAAALVGRVTAARPHGQLAAQVFLPDGPLALLPLPRPQELALVWSLPAAKAKALAAAPHEIVAHELDKATQNRFGALDPMGPLAAQDLHLSLAQHITDAAYVAIGDVAHVVHPLAGQGFNLTLRDGALLADSLYEARALGLPFDDASLLAQFARARHADAALTAATTHGLARLFQGPLAPLGRLGLGVVGRMVARRPSLRDTLTAQANGGVGDAPRLMRGLAFPQSGLK